MTRPWVRALWWACCVALIAAIALGGRLEEATGLPAGPGSLVLLLVFAGYRVVDWYVFRMEHPERPMAPAEPQRQTVAMALQRVAARRRRATDPADSTTDDGDAGESRLR